jgi:hypothetical protein
VSRARPLLAAFGVLALLGSASGRDPTLPELRRALLEAHGHAGVDRALDRLVERVGREPAFADLGAFGDWLGELPDGRANHPRVRLRRGWAYVSVGRGREAVTLLEAALADDPAAGHARAYLGEALRQAGDPAKGLELMATAARAGYRERHLRESVVKAAFQVRRAEAPPQAEDLPAYARLFAAYTREDAASGLGAVLARWLLDDLAAYERAGTARGRVWARAAAAQAWAALAGGEEVEGGAELALEAALALGPEDGRERPASERFDLLAAAYARGRDPESGGHRLPQAIASLAEEALAEGRFALAHRLARERISISDSPAAQRVLDALPPDLGD